MDEYRRGFDLPLTENKLLVLLLAAIVITASIFLWGDMVESGFDPFTCFACGSIILVLGYVLVMEAGRGFAKLHIVPEGIAVTLFGKTLRKIPREEIAFFGGFIGTRKCRYPKALAVCTCSMEDLAEKEERKTDRMFRNARTRPGWAEDMAKKYLLRCAGDFRGQLGLPNRDVLLLEWSPERLEMLMEMYPGVPWCDLSDKKKLDAERNASHNTVGAGH